MIITRGLGEAGDLILIQEPLALEVEVGDVQIACDVVQEITIAVEVE
jgi:hypothetical protein